ncbi:MAG: RNA methyltransferase [Myxococcota bacterium]|nr:RNA methyltransferase [Myxococcota bacterium]
MSGAIHCALVHHPVRDREGHLVASAITNVDVHDLARSARTYGLAGYWVVSPIAAQRLLVDRILEHWRSGAGARRVPERTIALSICAPVENIDAAITAIEAKEGARPALWITAARAPEGAVLKSWAEGRVAIAGSEQPILILFGTAHGLHSSLVARADVVLAPIEPQSDYNHLSVRAAAAITFDRLLGNP